MAKRGRKRKRKVKKKVPKIRKVKKRIKKKAKVKKIRVKKVKPKLKKKVKKKSIPKGAFIKDAKIYDVLDLWKKKPAHLRFDDTDVIIVTVSAHGKEIKENFFTCIKPDGTFNVKTANKISQLRRQKLAKFIKYYFNEDPKKYNLKKNIKTWKGKKVKLEGDLIFIP